MLDIGLDIGTGPFVLTSAQTRSSRHRLRPVRPYISLGPSVSTLAQARSSQHRPGLLVPTSVRAARPNISLGPLFPTSARAPSF